MAADSIDWTKKANVLKKELLSLSKSTLIRLCKATKVKCNSNDTKQQLVNNLIDGNSLEKMIQSASTSSSASTTDKKKDTDLLFDDTMSIAATIGTVDRQYYMEADKSLPLQLFSYHGDMDRDLVNGYIRDIEQQFELFTIIAVDIYHICFDYYFTAKFLFYLSLTAVDDEPAMSVLNNQNKQHMTCNVRSVNENFSTVSEQQWSIENSGIAFARNIKLPRTICASLRDRYTVNKRLKFNNVIFKCGGSWYNKLQNHCSALIVNTHQFQSEQQHSENIDVFMWDLPKLPYPTGNNYALYSYTDRCLYSICGRTEVGRDDEIHKLSFDINDNVYADNHGAKWKWKTIKLPSDGQKHGVCATLLGNGKHIMIAGGFSERPFYNDDGGYLRTVDVFDTESEKLLIGGKGTSMHHGRMDAGIYYDEVSRCCYVGGGFDGSSHNSASEKTVECYDMEKNVWRVLPPLSMAHDMNPMIWIKNNWLLYVMSVRANGIEFMDLREAPHETYQWDMYGDNSVNQIYWSADTNDLQTLFHTRFQTRNVTRNRMVGN